MGKYTELAPKIVEYVGGLDNITNIYHCMTRLRFQLKDKKLANVAELKALKGVLGVNNDGQDCQVIIGPDVDNCYKEVLNVTGFEATEKIDENLDGDLPKEKLTFKGILNAIVNAFSGAFSPIVPMFVLVGTFNTIAALIGPTFLKLVPADSAIYTNFYYVAQAITYFFPILIAVPCARHFKVNQYLALVVAFVLVYPDMANAIATGEYSVYGLPVPAVTYTSSCLPMILIIWIMSYIEKFADRISPSALKVILVPGITMLITLPLALCVLGPLGTYVGTALGKGMLAVYDVAGPLLTLIVGATAAFGLAFGMTRPVFMVAKTFFFTAGIEYVYMPHAMVYGNFVTMGLALAFALKTKDSEKKSLGLSSFLANILGGVSEPVLFGVMLPNKSTYLPVVIGGAITGLLSGIQHVGYSQFGPTNILAVIGFINDAIPGNFVKGCICAAVAFIGTFALTYVMYKDEKQA
ncbi:MAG: PTS transporter subunit EIIC [Erysipelotrichaceae bacterium]|nr:PTS transporter subunit EIIC [Erysipelotrichaceae bacterium]